RGAFASGVGRSHTPVYDPEPRWGSSTPVAAPGNRCRRTQELPMPPCLSQEELERFLAEQLPPADRDRAERHIEACPPCPAALHRLLAPPPAPGSTAPPLDPDPNFLSRLKRAPPDAVLDPAVAVVSLQVRFPGPPTPLGPLGQLQTYHIVELLGCGATGL